MIFEIPICDKLSDYLPKAWDDFSDHFQKLGDETAFNFYDQPFTFSESINFDVTYDDYDFTLHKNGRDPKYKQKKYECSYRRSHDYSFHRHEVIMEINVYDDIIHYVEMRFRSPDAKTYEKISEYLEKSCGKPVMEIIKKGHARNFFGKKEYISFVRKDHLTERYYIHENIVIQLDRDGSSDDGNPDVTLKAFTQLGDSSKEKFEVCRKEMRAKREEYWDSLPQYYDNHPDNN